MPVVAASWISHLPRSLLLHILPMRPGEPVPLLLLHEHCLHLSAAVS